MVLAARPCRDFYRAAVKAERSKFDSKAMFHVKQPARNRPKQNPSLIMNEGILLTNTKLLEDGVEDIFDVHPPDQPTQEMNRSSQLLCRKFLALSDKDYTALQRSGRLLQQFPLADPAN